MLYEYTAFCIKYPVGRDPPGDNTGGVGTLHTVNGMVWVAGPFNMISTPA